MVNTVMVRVKLLPKRGQKMKRVREEQREREITEIKQNVIGNNER